MASDAASGTHAGARVPCWHETPDRCHCSLWCASDCVEASKRLWRLRVRAMAPARAPNTLSVGSAEAGHQQKG